MNAGIFFAVLGGIKALIDVMAERQEIDNGYEIHFGGGDAWQLAFRLSDQSFMWPHLTLQGLCLTAWPGKKK